MIRKSQNIACDSQIKKKKREKKNLEAYWNSDDNITSIVKKISMKWTQQYQKRL